MKTVLYIHGFNGSPNGSTGSFIKQFFANDNVIAPQLDLIDFEGTIAALKKILAENEVNIVIGQSFGAFYAFVLNSDKQFQIVTNPCMYPSKEIPNLSDVSLGEEWIKKFANEESKVYKNISGQLAQSTFGIFGDKDELFSYKSTFKNIYDNLNKENTVLVEGNHSLSNASLQKGLSAAIKYLNEYLV